MDLTSELEGECGHTRLTQAGHELVGDPAACTLLGVMLASGDGAAQDPARAQLFFRKASAGADFDFEGCELASTSVQRGISSNGSYCDRIAMSCPAGCEDECSSALARKREQTIVRLDRGCEAGKSGACLIAGALYAYGSYIQGLGYLVEQDPVKAKAALDRGCGANLGLACGLSADYSVFDITAPKPDEEAHAAALRTKGCALGDGASCAIVGSDKYGKSGKLGPAIPDFVRACELGMKAVCRDLAEIYAAGNGITKDPKAASRFHALASEPWF